MSIRKALSFFILLLLPFSTQGALMLRDNLRQAKTGDYIVTAQNKTYTLLLVQQKQADLLQLEEVTIPMSCLNLKNFSWKTWIETGAPKNSSWVRYTIDLNDASMKEFYSFTKKSYYKVDAADHFLSKLLSLKLEEIPSSERKRIGPKSPLGGPDRRPFWTPQMVVDGKYIQGVAFTAWRTSWPKDNSELAGKSIEVYLPEDSAKYPSYFPYWLQVIGAVGKAKVRIVDSGSGLQSPKRLRPPKFE